MNRYSYIHGTRLDDVYASLGCSDGLVPFMSDVGAANVQATVDAVMNAVAGFTEMAGYHDQPKNDLPVSFRYAPMHLYKLSNMPKTMQPFCAVSVSGAEGKAGRVTKYSQTTFIGRELMHKAVEIDRDHFKLQFNYLDQIFGTYLLSGQELNGHRDGTMPIDFDRLPEKVTPNMRPQDERVVLHTIQAIYDKKAVVIRLEKGCGFNARAWELLVQIYSLMQPRLATEIGFATYHNPSDIAAKIEDTSMRIFVLPAECELKQVEDLNAVILDLSAPGTMPTLEKSDVLVQTRKWSALTWEVRQQAMEAVFADTETTFLDKDVFVQKSKDFFADPFFAWLRSTQDNNTITSLAELKAKYDSFPVCSQMPWAKEQFIEKIPKLLAKGLKMKQLSAEALAAGLFSANNEEKTEKQSEYLFASELGASDAIASCKASGKLLAEDTLKREKAIRAEYEAKIAQLTQEYEGKLDQQRQEYEAKVVQLKQEYEAKVAQIQENLRLSQEETAAAKAEGERILAEEKRKSAAALAAAEAAAAAALVLEQEKTRLAQEKAREELQNAQMRWDEERNSLVNEHDAAMNEANKKYAELREKASEAYISMKNRAEQAEHDLENSRSALDAAKREHEAEVNQLVESGKAEISRVRKNAQEEINHLKSELKHIKEDMPIDPDEVDALRKKLRSEEKTTRTLNENLASLKRKSLIGIIAGVLVGALICGGIFGLIKLLNKEEVPEPTETTVATEETTVPVETTELTEATEPETTAATEAVPEVFDWTNSACVEQLLEKFPMLKTVEEEQFNEWLPLNTTLGDEYGIVTVLTYQDAETESAEATEEVKKNYMLLLQRNENVEEAETELSEEEQTALVETAKSDVYSLEGAAMVLEHGSHIMLVFGEADMQKIAVQLFGWTMPAEEDFRVYVSISGEPVDVTESLVSLEGAAWWEQITMFSVGEAAQTAAAELAMPDAPVVYIAGNSKNVCFYEYAEDATDLTELKASAEEMGWELTEKEHYLVIAVPVADELTGHG